MSSTPRQSIDASKLLSGFGRLLRGYSPLLSIEVTRECPLHCPGCYAYGDSHLGGGVTLRGLNDRRGVALVEGVLDIVKRRRPMQVSFVGGEPLVRHKELSCILPVLDRWGIHSLVVTSAVMPFPAAWNALKRVRVAVSIDGLRPSTTRGARRRPTIAS
jgi:MoaA/NifB/PqqE/SkfB family radical SAM enzyme